MRRKVRRKNRDLDVIVIVEERGWHVGPGKEWARYARNILESLAGLRLQSTIMHQ